MRERETGRLQLENDGNDRRQVLLAVDHSEDDIREQWQDVLSTQLPKKSGHSKILAHVEVTDIAGLLHFETRLRVAVATRLN